MPGRHVHGRRPSGHTNVCGLTQRHTETSLQSPVLVTTVIHTESAELSGTFGRIFDTQRAASRAAPRIDNVFGRPYFTFF